MPADESERLKVKFLGSGSAFGDGGRLPMAISINADGDRQILIDCGPCVLPAMKKEGMDPLKTEIVFLSHHHGDHTGGMPFLFLYFQIKGSMGSKLTVVGPEGISRTVEGLREFMFPDVKRDKVEISYVEMAHGEQVNIKGLRARAFRTYHQRSRESIGYVLEIGDRILGYTGDTAWKNEFVEYLSGVDLVIMNCYHYNRKPSAHINYQDVKEAAGRLKAGKLVLAHVGQEVLDHLDEIGFMVAYDGMELDL